MRIFSLIVVVVFVSSLAAAADPVLAPAEFVAAAPGTIVEGRTGDGTETKIRVGDAGEFSYTFTDLVGDRGHRTHRPFCWGCDPKTYSIELERYRDLWPLEVGKSVKFQGKSAENGWVWIHKVKVVATETVNTELGPIDTFVVRQKIRGTGTNSWRATSKVWLAPSINWSVKSESWSTSAGKHTWEITALTPPG